LLPRKKRAHILRLMSDALHPLPETRRCHACGTRVRSDARFCGNCGVRLPQATTLDAPSLVGTTVAEAYRIDGVLGTGSMGVVYRAEQVALGRLVALKVIGESADDETTRARFRREARAASQLNHRNVVQVYDFGQLPGGQPYLAMELLKGQTLEQLIENEFPLPLARVIRIEIDILEALQAAHDLGILHRDLKPANVFISELNNDEEVAKVLDFGIATAMDSTLTGTQTWAPLTEAGFVCGTPAFMSPEQVQGFPLDQRSDLFSAAGLLYQMMTRERPFKGKSPVEVGANIVLKPLIPPSRVRPDLSPPDVLDAFLLQAMAKQPDDRFSSAEEMVLELRALLERVEATDAKLDPTSLPPTADWPESLPEDDAHYPDTVVNHEAVPLDDRAGSKASRRPKRGHGGPAEPPAVPTKPPRRAPLPTPFANVDPSTLSPPHGLAARSLRRTPMPTETPRPTLGRPTRSPDEGREPEPVPKPEPVRNTPSSLASQAPATIDSTEDELAQLERLETHWVAWLILVVLAAGVLLWLLLYSPWAPDFG
jgi:eukaryotic-like serine/threonine-protein kinase